MRDETAGIDVYVVDTGTAEYYVIADDEADAAHKVSESIGSEVKYAEWYSNDPEDADQ